MLPANSRVASVSHLHLRPAMLVCGQLLPGGAKELSLLDKLLVR